MAESTLLAIVDESDYKIEKRPDGTEDFHCLLPSCTGIFSYRTLRALNNHRLNTHSMPLIPKRKRGPKRSESSRSRSRSSEAIKRQVIKRAMDIEKRERGCRSMARLRALRHAMAQAGQEGDKDNIAQVIKEVDKALESWESSAEQRKMLLERRVRMAKVQWAIKGELVPLHQDAAEGCEPQFALEDGNENPLSLEHISEHDIEHSPHMENEGVDFHCVDNLAQFNNGKDRVLKDEAWKNDEVVELENVADSTNEDLEGQCLFN